jgi:hypothetical protein
VNEETPGRLHNLEFAESDDAELPDAAEGEGQKALFLALANAVNNGAIQQIVELLKQHWERKAKESVAQQKTSWTVYAFTLIFGAFLFGVLAALLWHGKITPELAAGLMGSLIGYWYGREKSK